MINKSILLWVGYYSNQWDTTDWVENGVGSSEYSVIKLAYKLQDKGYDVTIAGEVKTDLLWGVKWINKDLLSLNRGPRGLNEENSLKVKDHYNIVIGNNYIHFIKYLEENNISFDKAYFWMHNESYYPWYCGSELSNYKRYFKHPKLKAIVGVSKFHENLLKENSSTLFNYTPHESNTYIRSIDNAIDLVDYRMWKGETITIDTKSKISGRIIISSPINEGLNTILNNWNDWKSKRVDLSLVVCIPSYNEDYIDRSAFEGLKDVEWKDNINPLELKREIAKAEYWVCCSDGIEMGYITGLEMMVGKVKIINGPRNLMPLVGFFTGKEICNVDPDVIINKLLEVETSGGIEERLSNWALEQNWDIRVEEWISMFNEK